MHGNTASRLTAELRRETEYLDTACRQKWGITARMFRSVKFLFYMSTLLFTGYLVEYAGVEPFLGMLFAALLITGPEGVEAFLVNAGQLESASAQSQSPGQGQGQEGDDAS